MIVEESFKTTKGKAGLFWVANRSQCPIKVLDVDVPLLVFINGYVFAKAVGMKEEYGDPMPFFVKEGAKTVIRASEFKNTETIIDICKAEEAPVVIRKYGYEFYIAMNPYVYERYKNLFEKDNSIEEEIT